MLEGWPVELGFTGLEEFQVRIATKPVKRAPGFKEMLHASVAASQAASTSQHRLLPLPAVL